MKCDEHTLPRFYDRKLPRSLGTILTVFGGLSVVCIFLAMLQDESIFMILFSAVLELLCAAALIVGIFTLMAAYETVQLTPEGIDVRLWGLTLFRIDAKDIRSAVATTRGYRSGFRDHQLYMVQLYWNGKHPQNLALWLQWSDRTEEVLRENLPHIEFLL